MNEKLVAGNRVKHVNRTDWGLGEVMEDEKDNTVTVFFEDVGLKKFNLSIAQFARVKGDEATSDYLTALVEYQKKAVKSGPVKQAEQTSFQKAAENFLSYFPLGFRDPAYLSGQRSEREYKLKACELLRDTLNQGVLYELLDKQDYSEVCDRAKAIVNKTNLIHLYEKIWLNNAFTRDGAKRAFAISLSSLIYGEESLQARFEQFATMLYGINAAKWPIATYFLFLSSPDSEIFLKPEVTKRAAEVLGIDINYKPELNWLTYSQVRRLAESLRSRLIKDGREDLAPRDMIDVQSFIWVTAPGYF